LIRIDVEAAATRARALEILKIFEDADHSKDGDHGVNVEAYDVNIMSSRCFGLVMGFDSCGASFRMASRLVKSRKMLPR
jgi:hypothetical protein